MEAEDLLDKFARNEGFGNFDTVVINCHHSVIRSVAIAAVNEALRQPLINGSVCEHLYKKWEGEYPHNCKKVCQVCREVLTN